MIEVENLSKRYADFAAVKGLSFRIDAGEVVGLLGPNGAGKTTTMRMLTTILAPSAGTARIDGFDIAKQAAEVRARIGYLPEIPPLYPELRVREYLTFVGKIRGVKPKALRARVDEMIAQCALTTVASKLCSQLSRGFRQRVGLAQALIHNPPVIILDEPTSGLDPAQIIEIRNVIAGLRGNHTVVLSTHILPEVSQTCSRVVIIANGQIVVQGKLEELTVSHTLEERFLEAVSIDNRGETAEGSAR